MEGVGHTQICHVSILGFSGVPSNVMRDLTIAHPVRGTDAQPGSRRLCHARKVSFSTGEVRR
jgi:hypothetical protein